MRDGLPYIALHSASVDLAPSKRAQATLPALKMNSTSVKRTVLVLLLSSCWLGIQSSQEPPEGYFAFVESPNAEPPRVRRPPYKEWNRECPEAHHAGPGKTMDNLCGDLNKGLIPLNPMGQNVLGARYPFELLKNHTLRFLSRALPILKEDETLPKVAQYREDLLLAHNTLGTPQDLQHRNKRSATTSALPLVLPIVQTSTVPIKSEPRNDDGREGRKFCENGGGFMCMLYKAFNGEPLASGIVERREDTSSEAMPSPGAPPTPCPAKVEYATPVFARNYQGVWRYVVQIPYEGYFTQTLEVTRCLQSRCHYMDGGCLSSPRWVSLLVAEIFYPETVLPSGRWPAHRTPVVADSPPPVHDFQNYQQYLRKRAGSVPEPTSNSTPATTQKPSHCDGIDDIGCFQVRLYYDWFLVPGSCKCWRPDYFSRYVRRRVVGPDL